MGIKRLQCTATDTAISYKNWKRRGIEDLLRKLLETGSLDRRMESGRPCTSHHTCDNISAVEELTHFHKVS